MKILVLVCLSVIPITLLVAEQLSPTADEKHLARVVFDQYCFWTGEMKLGQIVGVVRTEAGFFQGHEVTLVDYDPAQISLEQLARKAQQAGVGDRLHLPAGSRFSGTAVGGVPLGASLDSGYRAAPAADQKKQIQGTGFAQFNLTPEQATKVNAFVRSDPRKAVAALAPAQREKLAASQ